MKKIMILIIICVGIFVGCGSKTALEITKDNYKEYGYNYADVELDKLIESNNKGDDTYKAGDLADAVAFLTSAKFGINLEGMDGND